MARLRERWDVETHPVVRATVLKALTLLAPDLAWPSPWPPGTSPPPRSA